MKQSNPVRALGKRLEAVVLHTVEALGPQAFELGNFTVTIDGIPFLRHHYATAVAIYEAAQRAGFAVVLCDPAQIVRTNQTHHTLALRRRK